MTVEVPAETVTALAREAGGAVKPTTVFVLAGARLFFRSGGAWYEEMPNG